MATDLPGVQKPGPQYHDGLASTLFQLHLDGREFLVDDLHHALYLLGGDWARPGLLPQQVHHVRRELVTSLQQDNRFVQNRTDLLSESNTYIADRGNERSGTEGKKETKKKSNKEYYNKKENVS